MSLTKLKPCSSSPSPPCLCVLVQNVNSQNQQTHSCSFSGVRSVSDTSHFSSVIVWIRAFHPADVRGDDWAVVKVRVISRLLAFHGAVCNVISRALQGMSQLVLGRELLRHPSLTGSGGGGPGLCKWFIKAACGGQRVLVNCEMVTKSICWVSFDLLSNMDGVFLHREPDVGDRVKGKDQEPSVVGYQEAAGSCNARRSQ